MLSDTIVVEVFVSVVAPTLTVVVVDEDSHVLPVDLSQSECPLARQRQVRESLQVVEGLPHFEQLSIARIAHKVEDRDSVLELPRKGVNIVVNNENVLEAHLAFEDVEILDDERVFAIFYGTSMLVVVPVMEEPVIRVSVDVVEDLFGKALVRSSEDAHLEMLVGEFEALANIGPD